jgi:hypothetical protein
MSNREIAVEPIWKLSGNASLHEIAREIDLAGIKTAHDQARRGGGFPLKMLAS